jgi:hypothetical protein
MRQAITGEDKLQAEADNMNNGKTIIYEIIEQLERLSEQQQKQILEYVKAMLQEAPQGTPGESCFALPERSPWKRSNKFVKQLIKIAKG